MIEIDSTSLVSILADLERSSKGSKIIMSHNLDESILTCTALGGSRK